MGAILKIRLSLKKPSNFYQTPNEKNINTTYDKIMKNVKEGWMWVEFLKKVKEKAKQKYDEIIAEEEEEEEEEEVEDDEEEKDIPPEVKEARRLDRKLNRIMNFIKKKFMPIKGKKMKERDLEKQLVQFLRVGFRKYNTEYQVRTRAGIIDIVIDDTIAIELKLSGMSNLQRLIGQAGMYVKDYPRVGIVILDQGNVKKTTLKEYLDMLNGIPNIRAISVIPSK